MKKLVWLASLPIIFAVNTSFKKPWKKGQDDFYIIIDKSDYEMQVYDSEDNWIVTYPVVFGNKDQGDKMFEGDRRTPEGTFHISSKRPHNKWSHFLAIDYPNAESYQKFNERKKNGLIPANARIGGSVGIHGTWPNQDFAIDRYDNWTEGCISTKNEYVKQLYTSIPVGTKVIIQK